MNSWGAILIRKRRIKRPCWQGYSRPDNRAKPTGLPCETKNRYLVCTIFHDEVHKLQETMITLANDMMNNVNKPPSVHIFIAEESMDSFYAITAASVRTPGSQYSIDRSVSLISHASVDEALQRWVQSHFRWQSFFFLKIPYSLAALDSDLCTTWYLYWPYFAKDVYSLVDNCAESRRAQGQNRHQQHCKLFLPSRHLELVITDILGQLPITPNRNPSVVLMTYRCSKLTRAVPMLKTTASHGSLTFINNWFLP